MDENSVERPLLLSRGTERVKKTPLFVSWAKWILKFVIWVIFLAWVALIFFIPAQFVNEAFEKWAQLTSGTVFGITGWYLLLTCYSTFVSPHPPPPQPHDSYLLGGLWCCKNCRKLFSGVQWSSSYYCIPFHSLSPHIWGRGAPRVCILYSGESSYVLFFLC